MLFYLLSFCIFSWFICVLYTILLIGSKAVGITGEIELVEVDGPTIYVALKGRFWHATDTVMMRVESFIKQRIPEVIEVVLDISKSSIVDDNRLNTGGTGPKKLF